MQGASVDYEITDGNRTSPPGSPMRGNDLEEDRRDVGDGTNWQKTAQDR